MKPTNMEPLRRELGQWMRQQRKQEGLTLDQLVKLSGCHKQTLINIEKGRNYSITQLLQACRALGATVTLTKK